MDKQAAEAFGGKILAVLNDGALALMISVGHQTGLFEALAGQPPRSSDALARAAGLHERYVREWLGAMVSGGVVVHDADAGTFALPDEHAASLTRGAGVDNLAPYAQYIAILAAVEQPIVAAFRRGGGVPYSAYPRLQQVLAEDSTQTLGASLLSRTLPMLPGVVERLRDGARVLDVGCGRGVAVRLMAEAFPRSAFTGIDISEEAIAAAMSAAPANASFEVRDAATLDAEAEYDLVTTFDAIHDQARPREVLRRIRSALRDDGLYLMVDIAASSRLADNAGHPLGPFLYTVSTMHCMTVSLAEGGEGLGAMWGEQAARELLAEAGFASVDVRRVEGDLMNSYYVARP